MVRRRVLGVVGLAACAILSLSACAGQGTYTGEKDAAHDVGIQLFQWNWDSIAKECTDTLGPAGVAWVLTSPPQEHITGTPWWTAYQPVSYKIESRLGTRDQFKHMVDTCHTAGVAIIADAVINHMTGQDFEGVGWAGSKYDHYEYPGIYSDEDGDFHHCGLRESDDIGNYDVVGDVQNCELVNLADLATETKHVRSVLAAYLNDLRSLGVDGFRIDAAKHMPADDIGAVLDAVTGTPYIAQEVIRSEGEPIQPEDYVDNGDVFEFGFATQLRTWFKTGQLYNIANIDGYGLLPSDVARTFVDNHDTERNQSTLRYKDGQKYLLANYLLLSSSYGSPVLYSGYAFTSANEGLPQDEEGLVTDVKCVSDPGPTYKYEDGDWVCQHHWKGILGMVGWRAAVAGTDVTDEWHDGDNYAFGREDAGYVAMNGSDEPLTRTFQTSMKAGTYDDVISGSEVEVEADGSLTVTVPAWGAVAIHK